MLLNTKEFTFEPFVDRRSSTRPGFKMGESGPLTIAKRKTRSSSQILQNGAADKLLVKDNYYHNVANEYTACWLAELLGIYAPHAYIFNPPKRGNPFGCQCAVGIEFIEGMSIIDYDHLTPGMQKDIVCGYTLSQLIDNEDSLQQQTVGNRIITFDFSEAFDAPDDFAFYSFYNGGSISKYGIAVLKLDAFRRHFDNMFLGNEYICDISGLTQEEVKRNEISTAKRAKDITDDDIANLWLDLADGYSMAMGSDEKADNVGEYYARCIQLLREWADKL